MKTKELENFSTLFKILSDSNRLNLVSYLCSCREANVSELSRCCRVDLSVVSRHLAKLKKIGVLGSSKKGKEVFYNLRASELASMLRELADKIESADCCQ